MTASTTDAITLLKTDHRKVEQLFGQYENDREMEAESRARLVRTVCRELMVHALIEEEIFYPAVRQATGDDDLVRHAQGEHDEAKGLIGRLEQMAADDRGMDECFRALMNAIRHHVREEETRLMPRAEGAGISMTTLGRQLEQRKADLERTLDEQAAARAAHEA